MHIKLADINENSWAKTSVGFGAFRYPALGDGGLLFPHP